MTMDEGEIIREYKAAKNKKDMVQVLADRNCVKRKEMAHWLADHDQEVDKRLLAEGRKPVPETSTVEPDPELEPNQSAKADAGKPRLTLVPMQIVYEIEKIRKYGNAKYPGGGIDNWKRVDPERHFEAFLRHVVKAWSGDHMQIDPESGYLHLAHAACDLAFFLALKEEAHD